MKIKPEPTLTGLSRATGSRRSTKKREHAKPFSTILKDQPGLSAERAVVNLHQAGKENETDTPRTLLPKGEETGAKIARSPLPAAKEHFAETPHGPLPTTRHSATGTPRAPLPSSVSARKDLAEANRAPLPPGQPQRSHTRVGTRETAPEHFASLDRVTHKPVVETPSKRREDSNHDEPAPETAPLPGLFSSSPVPVPDVRTASDSTLPVELNTLVDQITVSVDGVGDKKVEIAMSSDTLDGLRVEISDHQGQILIQLFSRSPEVSRLLDRQLDHLREALESRGVPVQSLEVRYTPSATPPSTESHGGAGRDSQHESDSGQRQDQRQDRRRK